MNVNFYRLEIFVLGFHVNSLDDLKERIEYIDDLHVTFGESQSTVLTNWEDSHELNQRKTPIEAYRKYFDVSQVGNLVDVPLRPKTELERENEQLRKENEALKMKLERIKTMVKEI